MGSPAVPQSAPSNSTPGTSSSYYTSDCSQGICTTLCPQFCNANTNNNNNYFLGPPPPLFTDDSDSDSSSRVSPLMIALISVLVAAFLLLSYYTFASRCCRRRRRPRSYALDDPDDHLVLHGAASVHFAPPAVNSNGGLDDTFIRSITVFKYSRSDGIVESTDCAVCLTEFKEEESLRLMPYCQHAFHPPCIDTWLRSHSNCPICRASMVGPLPPPPPPPPPPQPTAMVARMRVERGGDVVVVVDGGVRETSSDARESNHRREEEGCEVVDKESI